jgi:tetratricopeptide (TPR) repeat protein
MKVSKFLPFLAILLFLNSAYLAAFADPSVFYMANVILHLGLGILVTLLFIFFLIRNRSFFQTLGTLAAVLLLVGVSLGIVLMITGAHRPYRTILQAHIAITIIGVILFGIHLLQQSKKTDATPRIRRFSKVYIVIAILGSILTIAWRAYDNQRTVEEGYIVNPASPPESMYGEGQGEKGPFFPSSAETTSGKTIPSTFFMTSDTCARCHEDIYKQWFSSAHHFSSFNNQWYRKSIEYMQDVIGTKPSKWCGGCHDHAVLFNGMMDTPIKEIIDTPEAQAGLACTSCHAIVQVKSSMGQGDFVIEYPALHDLAASENKWMQKLHDFLVYTDPEPHKKVFMKPFVRQDTAEFCSSCHKVHLDIPVNSYRWFRGFNDYDNWQGSGVSGQGARAFYYPKTPMKCADCHMPLVEAKDPAAVDGKVNSHRFPAANTALPTVNLDQEQLRVITDFLKDDQVSVDIFAFSKAPEEEVAEIQTRTGEGPELASTFAVGEESLAFGASQAFIRKPVEVIGPIDKLDATVRRGDTIRLEVVVRTKKVGHFFPGGTVDAFDVWLELQAVDNLGKTIFWSGWVEDKGKGPVEKGAHFYRSLLLDEHGNVINKRNAWAARSVVYTRLVPPGAADTVHFRMKIPDDAGDQIFLKAKLNYRKFMWWNTQFAFAGEPERTQKNLDVSPSFDDRHFTFTGDTAKVSGKIKAIPDLPIVEMARDEATLKVVAANANLAPLEAKLDSNDRERWNDYGIGLLLQGDLKGAEQAFLKVTKIDPKYADGWVNIARSRVQEGDTAGALEVLDKALSIDPDLSKTHFFKGMALKAQGKYDQALFHLQKASNKYPLDRVVRNQMGRILFLKRNYQPAIEQFQKTLSIDPEDVTAHYNLMLCYQGLGNKEMAEIERKLYMRFKADEAAQEITGSYRKLNPEDNNERQQIHEHGSPTFTTTAYD